MMRGRISEIEQQRAHWKWEEVVLRENLHTTRMQQCA